MERNFSKIDIAIFVLSVIVIASGCLLLFGCNAATLVQSGTVCGHFATVDYELAGFDVLNQAGLDSARKEGEKQCAWKTATVVGSEVIMKSVMFDEEFMLVGSLPFVRLFFTCQ